MNEMTSRREAMQWMGAACIAAAGLGTAAIAQTKPTSATRFITDTTGNRHAPVDASSTAGSAEVVFTVDPHAPRQTILGFGAALTEAACTVITGLPASDRAEFLDELYNPARSNFSINRLCIGASDYSKKLYSYDEGEPDPQMKRFSIEHDEAAVLPVLRAARAIRPDLFLFGSPWSPPGWMKYGGSMLGGSIKPHLTSAYARYITRYLQAYEAAGVRVDAMTLQNEIDADQDGKMPACTWPEEVEAEYLVHHLGPLLRREKLKTAIWLLDHNYNLAGRVLDQLARDGVKDLVQGIAWHGYAGSPDSMEKVHRQHPDLQTHWTEGGDAIESPNLATAWGDWAHQFAGILSHGAQSITTWNLALDETGHPNIGPFACAGMVTIDSKTKAIKRNGIYWALVHYAKAFPRGTQILSTSSNAKSQLSAITGRRPDGTIALVLSNPNNATVAQVEKSGSPSDRVALPQNSVVTVVLG